MLLVVMGAMQLLLVKATRRIIMIRMILMNKQDKRANERTNERNEQLRFAR